MFKVLRGFFCNRCHQPMRRVYTWFEHVNRNSPCECQGAYYAEVE